MREILAKAGDAIDIGKRGEHQATCVLFDISDWKKSFGIGEVHLLHQRNGDRSPYPCAVSVDSNIVRWIVERTDVAIAGRGKLELQYYVDEARVKSATYSTKTAASLDNEGAIPDAPHASWLEQVLETAVQSKDAAEESQKYAEESKNAATDANDAVLRANAAVDDAKAIQKDVEATQQQAEQHAISAANSAVKAEQMKEAANQAANRAQAEAERASVPAVKGVYNVVLVDRVTGLRYALIVENERLILLEVSSALDVAEVNLIDVSTGTSYVVEVESGRIKLKEV